MLVGSSIEPNRINWESANRITQKSNLALSASRIYAGDLVTVRVGEPGITAVVPGHLDGCNCASMMIVRQHRSFNSQWLCHVMNSASGLAQIEHVQYGTAQKQFNISDAVNFSYPFPHLAEQEAIAEALSDADALIESLEQLLTKKRQIKQGAMHELLTGQCRLPGFAEDWGAFSIGQLEEQKLVTLGRGNVISKKDIEATPGSNPIYSSSVHNNGKFGEYGAFMFDEELITWSVDGGGNFFYRPKHRFSVTNVCGYMRVATAIIKYSYLAYQLQYQHSQKRFDYQTKAHPSVVRNDYVVQVPAMNEQTAIATVLSDMDADIAALETKLTKARQIKQGMMQELLTGKTRLV
jgi:type I restriction enzyme S subunit